MEPVVQQALKPAAERPPRLVSGAAHPARGRRCSGTAVKVGGLGHLRNSTACHHIPGTAHVLIECKESVHSMYVYLHCISIEDVRFGVFAAGRLGGTRHRVPGK